MNDLLPYISPQINITLESLKYFTPELYLGVLFLLVLITGLIFRKTAAAMCRIIAVAGMVCVLMWDVVQCFTITDYKLLFSGMALLGPTGVRFKLIIDVLAVFLLIYFPWDRQLKAHKKGLSDLYTVTIAGVLGCHLMVMASHLLSVFVAIEFVSLASYLLVAYKSENGVSAGAGLKYVLFGAAASAVMLYGISLLYGLAGSAELYSKNFIGGLAEANTIAVGFALVLVLAGIGFKLSFVPMHFWVPDVYQGAATPITAFLSTLPKIAGFALLFNFILAFSNQGWAGFDFRLFFSVAGVVTMILGNFAAVMQKNVKRMLAYSSIGHTGFALIAIVSFTPESLRSLVFYLLVYGLANIGALMLASYFANTTGAEDMEDYRGFGFKLPAASVCFVVVLISLTGLPATAGFIGKLLLFKSMYSVYEVTHNGWHLALLITGAVTTVVSLFYYIKIPLYLFLRKGDDNHEYVISNKSLVVAAIIISLLVVAIGLFPDVVTKFL